VTDAPKRDRDSKGRPRNARPRDALGRPLPYGSKGVPGIAEEKHRDNSQTLQEADILLGAGLPFQAHEILELRWKHCPAGQRDLWQALAQLCVSITHFRRGNQAGAVAILKRARTNLDSYAGPVPAELNLPAVLDWIDRTQSDTTTYSLPAARDAIDQPKLWRSVNQ
jgi:hypothetical protein